MAPHHNTDMTESSNGNGRRRIVVTPETHFMVTLGGMVAGACTAVVILWKVFGLVTAVNTIPVQLRQNLEYMKQHCAVDWTTYNETCFWAKFREENPNANLKIPDPNRIKKGAVE